MALINDTISLATVGEKFQLELINNISNVFQNFESKNSETRSLLDLLTGFIVRKFGNDPDFPQEISKILGLSPISHNYCTCGICQATFTNPQDLNCHSTMIHCLIPAQPVEEKETSSLLVTEDEFSNPTIRKVEVPEIDIENDLLVPNSLSPKPEEVKLETIVTDTTPGSGQGSQISFTLGKNSSSPNREEPIKRISTNQQSSSKKHTRRNGKFPCMYENCGKIYTTSSHLTTHVRVHTGEKPYLFPWPNCLMKFRRGDELSRHTRFHTGDKPYQCDICLRRFGRRDQWLRHMKTALLDKNHHLRSVPQRI